jgi:hypothetical protein
MQFVIGNNKDEMGSMLMDLHFDLGKMSVVIIVKPFIYYKYID